MHRPRLHHTNPEYYLTEELDDLEALEREDDFRSEDHDSDREKGAGELMRKLAQKIYDTTPGIQDCKCNR